MILLGREAKLGASFFALASAAILLTRLNGGVALLWVANAPLLAFLCRQTPVGRWRSALAWVAPASVAASTLFGPVLWAAPFLAMASVTEAVLAALLLRRWLKSCDFFESSRSVLVFSAVAGIAAPMTSGLIGATAAFLAFHKPWLTIYVDWVVGHGLGTLIASPVVLLLMDGDREAQARRFLSELWGEGGVLIALVAAVTAGVFWQERLPLLFLPTLPILLATFKLGRPGAALSMLLVALIGGVATAAHHGPVVMTHMSHVGQLQFFQVYLAATFLISLPIAGTLQQREHLMRALAQSEARHRRIVGRSQDVIFETDAAGRWTFLSEAWTRITGHRVDESLGQRVLAAVVREDRPALVAAFADAHAATGNGGQTEVRFTAEDGVRWAAVSVGSLRDGAGRVSGAYGTISDITDRKQAEAEIVDSERRYRVLADNTTDMIARIGLDGCYRSVTSASTRLLGIAPDDLVGTSFLDAIEPAYQGEVLGVLINLLGGAVDQSCTYRQRRRGGDPIWVEAVFRLLRHDGGSSQEVIATIRDVSRRKALEVETATALSKVRESNRLFEIAGSLASIGHWRIDLATDNLIWSDEVFRIHGIKPGFPPPVAEAIGFYHSDDRARVANIINGAMADRCSFGYGARLIRADGSIRHVIARGHVEFDETGTAIAMFGVFQDVTERALAEETLRTSEARFRLITEQASDMIALIDLDGVCLFMSPASQTILGTPPGEMIGTTPADRVHEADRPALQLYRQGLRTGTALPGASHRFRMRRADGDFAWLEASSRLAAIGDTPCIVTVWRDVSSQVAIELELKTAKAEAEAASVAKAGFLANMSHEIRTPMNGVIGFAELLLTSDLTDEQRRDAGLIADSGRTMMKLLNDILDLSKIEAGQLDVVTEPFDLPHVLRACGKLLGPSAAHKRLGFAVEVADDVPQIVLGDALRLRQIVLNLLGNAIKFTERGEVKLAARMTKVNGEQRLLIAVSDTGIGIAPERQGSIFEEFVQADHSITRRYGGSGLGLAISNRLARLMGGYIDLYSLAGLGTTVTLELSAVTAENLAVPNRSSLVGGARRPERPARVLLAEDHEVNQLLVCSMLAHGGHTVTVVTDGEQAVEAVSRSRADGEPFDLVLMDMQMPVLDGLAATHAIRAAEPADGRRLPIVALTANAFASDLDACRAAGMDDHIAKPVSLDALLDMVARWSGTREDQQVLPASSPTVKTGGFRPSAAAQAKYAEHRARTLEQVDALIRRGSFVDVDVEAAAELLHKLAGTAGMFGEADLGDRASEMEKGLHAWPAGERAVRIPAAARRLQQAA